MMNKIDSLRTALIFTLVLEFVPDMLVIAMLGIVGLILFG